MLPKFRVWDKVAEDMFTPEVLELDKYGKVTGIFSKGTMFSIEDFELLQSTGLFDKNGAEIFEVDILKVFVLGDEGAIAKVIFKNGMFGIEDDMHGYGYDRGLYSLHQILSLRDAEIIGNKFTHPHLLEEE